MRRLWRLLRNSCRRIGPLEKRRSANGRKYVARLPGLGLKSSRSRCHFALRLAQHQGRKRAGRLRRRSSGGGAQGETESGQPGGSEERVGNERRRLQDHSSRHGRAEGRLRSDVANVPRRPLWRGALTLACRSATGSNANSPHAALSAFASRDHF